MRTDKELLELLLNELPGLMNRGNSCICIAICTMRAFLQIKKEEKSRLLEIIEHNPTEKGMYDAFYFPPGEVEPRIKYLKQLIKKYENT